MNQKLTVPQSSSILAKITQQKETKKRLFKYSWEEFENDFLGYISLRAFMDHIVFESHRYD
jgi:hypothetical protein